MQTKTWFVRAAAVVLTIVAVQSASAKDAPASPSSGPLGDKVLMAYEAYQHGDVEAIVALTSPDVAWGGIGPEGYGAPLANYRGHDGVRRWFSELALDNQGYSLEDLEFHEDATTVTVTGVHRVTFDSTGRSAAGKFAHVFRFRGGLIVDYCNYFDATSWFEAKRLAPVAD